jgi:hypothetical protein
LRSIGFEAAGQAQPTVGSPSDIVAAGSGLSLLGSGWYAPETFAGDSFRWASNDAEVRIAPSPDTSNTLRMELEPGPGLGSQPFDLQVSDTDAHVLMTVPVTGRQVISIPITAGRAATTTLRLHVAGGGQPTPDDPRTLNFRVFALGWVDGQ